MTTKRFDLFRRLRRSAPENERGFVLIYMSVMLTALLLFTGLALDGGRAYVVQAQLSKAVDGAALGAARMLNSGDPQGEATSIFNANFPVGYMGTTSVMSPPGFQLTPDEPNGRNIVRVWSNATMPTTFMKLGNIFNVTVSAEGEATRRMVDLSLVLDVSGSIGWRWPYVRDASRDVRQRILRKPGSRRAHDVQQRRSRLGPDASHPRLRQSLGPEPTSRPISRVGAPRWSRASTGAGTSCARCRRPISRAFASSCSSPTARRTAFQATGTAVRQRVSEHGTSRNNGADPDNQTHHRPHISGFFDTETGAATNPSPNGFSQDSSGTVGRPLTAARGRRRAGWCRAAGTRTAAAPASRLNSICSRTC